MPTTAGIKVATLSYIIIYVRDTEKSLAFYRDTLGLKVKLSHPGWAELETGGTILALHESDAPPSNRPEGAWPTLVFSVDDVHQATRALKEAGVTVTHEPRQVCEEGDKIGLSADFLDPDGNLLSIFSLVPRK